MKDVKEYSVEWTHCDRNCECLNFNKVGKPSSSTIITANNNLYCIINTSYQENALPVIHIKIHHTSYQILQAEPVLSPGGINFATLF